jgi:hypothetical protein
MVQIGNELHQVAAPLESYSDGTGKIQLTHSVRSAPADNAPVIIHQPMCRMMLADQSVGWSNEPRGRGLAMSSFSLEFVEDIL